MAASVGGGIRALRLAVVVALSGCADATAPVTSGSAPAALAVGGTFSCALREAGARLYCWGINGYGVFAAPLGGTAVPVLVATGLTLASISAGNKHLCALTTTQSVVCWGSNLFGELGDGTLDARATPRAVSGTHAFRALDSGYRHTCALDTDSIAWCWGDNQFGQLGTGDTAATGLVPAAVATSLRFAAISAGAAATCGLTGDGTAWCWGSALTNEIGQAGPDVCGWTACRRTPGAVNGARRYGSISAGARHTCAVELSGGLRCWGANDRGQLGVEHVADECQGGVACSADPVAVSGRFSSVSAAGNTSCATAADGTLWCWGANCEHAFTCEVGLIGSNAPEPFYSAPQRVATELGFSGVDQLFRHICAVTPRGAVYCWGDNSFGQVGDGTRVHRNTPTRAQVPG